MTDRRRLIVMRHTKTEPFAASDHGRRLTERGAADAADAGAHLTTLGLAPDHAVVSTAERTRMTWAAVRAASGSTGTESFEEAAYHGDAQTALDTLSQVPETVRTVIWIGHNPTASDLCHLLDDGTGDPEAVSGMLSGFPTGALVVFEVDVAWGDLGSEDGRVVDFYVARS